MRARRLVVLDEREDLARALDGHVEPEHFERRVRLATCRGEVYCC